VLARPMFIAQRQTRFSNESAELATIPVEQGVVLFDHEHGVASACRVLHKGGDWPTFTVIYERGSNDKGIISAYNNRGGGACN